MRYNIIKQQIINDELGQYYTFGIQDEKGFIISDVSTNKHDVEKLLSILNKQNTPRNYLLYEIDKFFSEI